MNLLQAILAVPLLGAVAVYLARNLGTRAARLTALTAMGVEFLLGLALLAQVSAGGAVEVDRPWNRAIGASFNLRADGLSALMVALTGLLGTVAVIAARLEIPRRVAAFHIWLLLLVAGIQIVFVSHDALLFYFGYELMLIPAYFLIGQWGRDQFAPAAAMRFFLFTFAGSVFILAAFLKVYFANGAATGTYTFNLDALVATGQNLPAATQWWVFLGLLAGFAVKVPLVPFHQWLPETYAQASTPVALMLSGLMSKTGAYGLIRFAYPMAPEGARGLAWLVIGLALAGILYGALAAYGQRNFKALVAYSSIAHLGFVILGIASGNALGYQGAVLQMVNHGLATGALFLVGGLIMARTGSLSFETLGGLWARTPALGGFLLFFALASLGLPGTGNFIGELYIVAGAFSQSAVLGALAAFGVMLGALYSLKLYIDTMQGPEKPARPSAAATAVPIADVSSSEFALLGTLAAALVVIGLAPGLVTGPLQVSAASAAASGFRPGVATVVEGSSYPRAADARLSLPKDAQ